MVVAVVVFLIMGGHHIANAWSLCSSSSDFVTKCQIACCVYIMSSHERIAHVHGTEVRSPRWSWARRVRRPLAAVRHGGAPGWRPEHVRVEQKSIAVRKKWKNLPSKSCKFACDLHRLGKNSVIRSGWHGEGAEEVCVVPCPIACVVAICERCAFVQKWQKNISIVSHFVRVFYFLGGFRIYFVPGIDLFWDSVVVYFFKIFESVLCHPILIFWKNKI